MFVMEIRDDRLRAANGNADVFDDGLPLAMLVFYLQRRREQRFAAV
jgi:hypothetical protein